MSVASALKRHNLGVLCCRQVAHYLQPLLVATDELEKDRAQLVHAAVMLSCFALTALILFCAASFAALIWL